MDTNLRFVHQSESARLPCDGDDANAKTEAIISFERRLRAVEGYNGNSDHPDEMIDDETYAYSPSPVNSTNRDNGSGGRRADAILAEG